MVWDWRVEISMQLRLIPNPTIWNRHGFATNISHVRCWTINSTRWDPSRGVITLLIMISSSGPPCRLLPYMFWYLRLQVIFKVSSTKSSKYWLVFSKWLWDDGWLLLLVTPPKTNVDTRHDGLEKVISFPRQCLASMLDSWGVVAVISETLGIYFKGNLHTARTGPSTFASMKAGRKQEWSGPCPGGISLGQGLNLGPWTVDRPFEHTWSHIQAIYRYQSSHSQKMRCFGCAIITVSRNVSTHG